MPEKLDRCVDKVKGKKGIDNAYAVCNASIGEAFIANNNYPDMNQEDEPWQDKTKSKISKMNEQPWRTNEGGVGSGIKGHTTPKDDDDGRDYGPADFGDDNGDNGGDIESQNLQDAQDWINAYRDGMNDEEIRAKLQGMGIPHQTINQAFSNVENQPDEDYGYIDKRTDDEIKQQVEEDYQTNMAQGHSPDKAKRWALGMFGRRTDAQGKKLKGDYDPNGLRSETRPPVPP